ncbi:MAG: hypothetical protein ACRDHD_08200 [Candidatus Limnocylindria bacterium]
MEQMAGDQIGRRYQALALRLGRHLPGYVDFWLGPAELREAIAGEEPAPPVELHMEAVALHEMAASLPADSPEAARRRAWLMAQLGAMSATARRLGGEEIAYADLVEALFDVVPAATPGEDVARAHAVLADVLPSGPSLRERLLAHDEATRVPAEALIPAIQAAAEVLRRRTAEDFGLPASESIEVVAVQDRPWGASAPYLGGLRTRIEVNLDLPATLGTVVYLAAHEAYPGHHAERATKEQALWREAGLDEAAVACLYTPEISISEGMADLAREVVMTDAELGAELRRLVERLALPIASADAEREVSVGWARDLLRDLTADAGLALHQHGLPEAEVRQLLAELALRSEARIEHDLVGLRDPFSCVYPFAYTLGRRLIAPWLAAQGQTTGYARLLREQLTPGRLRSELGEAPALFPGSLA